MQKIISTLILIAFAALLITRAWAQEKKPIEPPQPAMKPYQELMYWWNITGRKVIDMAEEFPEDKYNFKAQKDERTFGENLVHITAVNYALLSSIKGIAMGPAVRNDSLYKLFPTKKDIVNYLKQSIADGDELIMTQGDSLFAREVKYPWANQLVHASFCVWNAMYHTNDHYGQLAVYYRLNGMIPPESRPRK